MKEGSPAAPRAAPKTAGGWRLSNFFAAPFYLVKGREVSVSWSGFRDIFGNFMRLNICFEVVALTTLGMSTANGDVVFSNLTSPTRSPGAAVGGPSFITVWQSFAVPFTPSQSYSLIDAKVSVAAANNPLPNNRFNIWIASDAGGLPGALIEQIGFSVAAPANPGIVTANSIAMPITLTAGAKYWLVLAPFDTNTSIIWAGAGSLKSVEAVTHTPSADSGWFRFLSGSDDLQFQIDGTPTPANPTPTPLPSSLLLCLTGFAGVGLYHATRAGRRKPLS